MQTNYGSSDQAVEHVERIEEKQHPTSIHNGYHCRISRA